MSPNDEGPLDPGFLRRLIVGEEARAAGQTPPPVADPDTTPEAQRRIEEDLACARLLQDVLGEAAAEQTAACLGRFRLRRRLGQGAYGVVWLAYDPRLRREVALKVPRPDGLTAARMQRFLREARAAAGLQHPNIVPVYEVGEIGPVCFIASAYSPGLTLAEWLRQQTEPPPPHAVAGLLAALADAVQHAHERGVVHRDLKPANVLLSLSRGSQNRADVPVRFCEPRLSEAVPKITDFGLAKLLEGEDDLTVSGAVLGTPCYMAPEQAGGPVGPAADVYALGVILYECLTGRPPFRAETVLETMRQVAADDPLPPGRLRPDCPRDLETVCLKCLAKEPARRYASARDLADDLRRFLDGQAIVARPCGSAERVQKWARRHPARAALAGVSAAALTALVAGGLWHDYRLQSERDHAIREELRASQREAEAVRMAALAHEQRSRAEAREREARRHLYAAQMHLAHQAWQARRIGRALDLLRRQRPEPGREDLRGFEWFYLWKLCHGAQARWSGWNDPPPEQPVFGPALALTLDGRTAATPDGLAIRLWDVIAGRPRARLEGHGGAIRWLTFAADGRTLASAAADGTVRCWDVETGRPTRTLGPLPSGVRSLALTAEGRLLATSGADGTIRLWDVPSGRERASLRDSQRAGARLLTFDASGRTLAAVTDDQADRVRLWNASDGRLHAVLTGHRDAIDFVLFSPDGRQVATRSADGTVRCWESATGRCVHEVRAPAGAWVTCVAFSPDGTRLATGCGWPFDFLKPGTVRLWGTADHQELTAWEVPAGGVWALAYSPDGKTLAYGDNDGTIRLRDLAAGHDPAALLGHEQRVHHLAFAPDGPGLTSLSRFDHTVQRWDTVLRARPQILPAHGGEATSVAFAPDGQSWASAGGDGVIRLWDRASGLSRELASGTYSPVTTVAFAPDGGTLATGTLAGEVRLWDVATVREKAVLRGHRGAVRAVAFSPDGRRLVTSGGQLGGNEFGEVVLWDAAIGREVARWTDWPATVWSAAFTPDGRRLAAVGDRQLRVWDADGGRETFRRTVPEYLRALAVSPDGQTLATSGWDRRVRLWDAASGTERAVLEGHADPITALAYSSDGKLLVSGSNDATVKLWDAATGQLRFTLGGRRSMIKSVALSPDGRTLAAARADGFVEVWDSTDDPVAEAADDAVDERWLRQVTALPPAAQVEAVARKLRRRNPGFDGRVRPRIRDGQVEGLELLADAVSDLSPLRGLAGLKHLVCDGSAPGKGKLADLSPLRALPLTTLQCRNNPVASLAPLQGMRLTVLNCAATQAVDLAPLRGMPLSVLDCGATPVSDLTPLHGLPLTALYCSGTAVADLAPLRGMRLGELACGDTRVSDLEPLRGMPLTLLWCYRTRVTDLSPLHGMPLVRFSCTGTAVSDLGPLRGLPLAVLHCQGTHRPALEPLRGLPLRILTLDERPPSEMEILRSTATLETINAVPVTRYWSRPAKVPGPPSRGSHGRGG